MENEKQKPTLIVGVTQDLSVKVEFKVDGGVRIIIMDPDMAASMAMMIGMALHEITKIRAEQKPSENGGSQHVN